MTCKDLESELCGWASRQILTKKRTLFLEVIIQLHPKPHISLKGLIGMTA
jgi:antitoxin component HigA of HigAB toxin-antitoxin module